jgi:hypothetical protein
MRKTLVPILLICLVITVIAVGVQLTRPAPDTYSQSPVPVNTTNVMTITVPFPYSPQTAPVYKVTKKTTFHVGGEQPVDKVISTPTEEEAPALAEKALAMYGGLPYDAVLRNAERVTVKQYNTSAGTIEAEYPQRTEVIFGQQVAGHPVVGPGARIRVGLGENGELLELDEIWRSLEYDKEVPVISAGEAFEKLKRYELIGVPQCCISGLVVSSVDLGYYAEDPDHNQEYVYPVWVFYATTHPEIDPSGTPFVVDARKEDSRAL